MAAKIKGITIELGGDTSKFQKAIKEADKAIRDTQKELKSLEKALKIDPGNTELLARKQELLAKAVDGTSGKLKTLKEAYDKAMDPTERAAAIDKVNQKIEEQQKRIEAAKQAMEGMEKGSDAYKAQETEIAKANRALEAYNAELDDLNSNHAAEALKNEIAETEAALKAAKQEAKDFGSVLAQQVKEAGTQLQETGEKITGVGKGLTKSVTAPIVAVGGASVAAWKEVDEAYDTIIKKTGATGDAFESLKKITDNLATSIPTSFDTAANAVGEVNTRFGITGQQLEDLSGQFIKFSELNDTDVSSSIDSVQAAMDAYGLGADKAAAVLDTLNKVGQDTGISMDTLTSGLVTNATAFQDLNLDIADAAKLLGELEKRGIDSGTALQGLSKAQADALKNGTSIEESLRNAFSSAEAAISTFGAKAGPKLYAAFQQGTISVEDFTNTTASLGDALGNVSNTYDATLDPLDQMTTVMNELKSTGADIVDSSGPMLVEIMKQLAEAVKTVSEWWKGLDDNQKESIVKIAALAAAIGPLLVILGNLITVIGTVMTYAPAITAAFGTVAAFVTGTLIPAIGGVVAAIAPVVAAAAPVIAIVAAVVAAGWALVSNWETIKTTVTQIFTDLWNGAKQKFDSMVDLIKGAIEKIKGLFNFKLELPKVKLPHFKVSGSANPIDWLKQGVPKITVDWYRKAENQPYLFNSPQLIGVGDVPEVVIGADAFRRMQAGQTVINQTINAQVRNDTDIDVLATKISQKIQTDVDRRNAGWR